MENDFLTNSDTRTLSLLKDEDFLNLASSDVDLTAALSPPVLPSTDAVVPPEDEDSISSLNSASTATSSALTANGSVTTPTEDVTDQQIDSLLQLPPEVRMDQQPAWEEDVLLADGLPPDVDEASALMLDFPPVTAVDEDFQKMLNDWETHIGSLQSAEVDISGNPVTSSHGGAVAGGNAATVVPDGGAAIASSSASTGGAILSNSSSSCSMMVVNENNINVNLNSTSSYNQAAVPSSSAAAAASGIFDNEEVAALSTTVQPELLIKATTAASSLAADETAVATATDAAGLLQQQQSKQQAVLSTMTNTTNVTVGSRTSSSVGVSVSSVSSEEDDDDDSSKASSSASSSSSSSSSPVAALPTSAPPKKKKTLAGVVISSGPGGHFETYEATAVLRDEDSQIGDNEQRRQKEISSCPNNTTTKESPSVIEASNVENLLEQFEATADFLNDPTLDPKRASQIVAAVKTHFAGSKRKFAPGTGPQIFPSRRIKESLPKEIIERIKASSQKKKTIAIIEPVQRYDKKTVSETPSASSKPFIPGFGGMTSRFQEAGASLNRTRLRQLGVTNSHSPTPQQIQVNLDHDYCSSNRNRRGGHGRHATASGSTGTGLGLQQQIMSRTQPKTIIRVSSTPIIRTKTKDLQLPHVVAVAKGSGPSPTPIIIQQQNHSAATSASSPFQPIVVPVTGTSHVVISPPTIERHQQQQQQQSQSAPSRRDSHHSDTKKDSGLESGEMSDASNNDDEHANLYTRVPAYLSAVKHPVVATTASAKAATAVFTNSSSVVTVKEEVKDELPSDVYDRLPSYVTGIKRATEAGIMQDTKINITVNRCKSSSLRSSSDSAAAGKSGALTGTQCDNLAAESRARKHRQNIIPSATNSVEQNQAGKTPQALRRSLRKRPASESSPAASASSSDSESGGVHRARAVAAVVPPPLKKTRNARMASPKLSPIVASPVRRSSRRLVRSRRRSDSSSDEDSSASINRSRSRSPLIEKRRSAAANRRRPSYDRDRFSRDRSRRDREHLQEKHRQIEERRIIYVGKIEEGTTRQDLRTRFEAFGPIDEISLHFRDRGDNYGFVTFRRKEDAFTALEHGNDNTNAPKLDICFGGRRTFCKEKYSDLDSLHEPLTLRGRSGEENPTKRRTQVALPERDLDFDSLLRQAKAGIKK